MSKFGVKTSLNSRDSLLLLEEFDGEIL